jgi:hypothetical protein
VRYLSIVFLLGLPALTTGEPLTPRPLDPIAAETFASALARSPAVRSLVATLERSNVIVHIESSQRMPAGLAGTTRFVAARGGFRYVRVTIYSELSQTERAVILGHELQHACEVAESAANNVDSMRQLFTLVGRRTGDYYETATARQIESRIRMELRGKRYRVDTKAPLP